MFSKEESRLIRQEFWTSFGKSFPKKWILYNTKTKGLSFKFHFDTKKALVALDLEDHLELRIKYWDTTYGRIRISCTEGTTTNRFIFYTIFPRKADRIMVSSY